jgi:hypothetical protein
MTSVSFVGLRSFALTVVGAIFLVGCAGGPSRPAPAALPAKIPVTTPLPSPLGQATPPDPICQNAPPSSGHASIADQEAADAAYDRVNHLIQTLHLVGYSSGYVALSARQAHIYWVGPVPLVLRHLPPGRDHGSVVFDSAPYTFEQMKAASDHVIGARLSATDPSGYVISSVDQCVDGTGIRVQVADPRNGDTPPKVIPASLIAKIKTLAGTMPALVVGGYVIHPA